jgi:hypothetical protein
VALERVSGDQSRLSPGVVTVSTVGRVARTLREKPGGYLHNDISPPGIYLDNMPSWEDGVLKEVSDSLGALRNDLSRSQTQSVENLDLRKAVEFLNYDGDSWILPATESEFREGLDALDGYLSALVAGDEHSARFYVRADKLAAYLAVVEKRLGSYAQRLSASVGDSDAPLPWSRTRRSPSRRPVRARRGPGLPGWRSTMSSTRHAATPGPCCIRSRPWPSRSSPCWRTRTPWFPCSR